MIDNIFYLFGISTCCGISTSETNELDQNTYIVSGLVFPIWIYLWEFPKIAIPQNGLFLMENPIKIDDLGVDTPI